MKTETIKWRTTKVLPKTIRGNRLNAFSFTAEEKPHLANKLFVPVLFIADGSGAIAGRFFPQVGCWVSLQGVDFDTTEVQWWAPIPKGPRKWKRGN